MFLLLLFYFFSKRSFLQHATHRCPTTHRGHPGGPSLYAHEVVPAACSECTRTAYFKNSVMTTKEAMTSVRGAVHEHTLCSSSRAGRAPSNPPHSMRRPQHGGLRMHPRMSTTNNANRQLHETCRGPSNSSHSMRRPQHAPTNVNNEQCQLSTP